MIKRKHIIHALTLHETGTFRMAAKKLQISQPALTRSIQSLEQSLGSPLFDRCRNGVTATETGKILISYGKRISSEFEELQREIDLLQGLESGKLLVSAGPAAYSISILQAATLFLNKHPNISCQLKTDGWKQIPELLEQGTLDLGISEGSEIEDLPLRFEPLAQHLGSFICCPNHPLLKSNKISMENLFQYPWSSCLLPERISKFFPKNKVNAGYIDKETKAFHPALILDNLGILSKVLPNTDIIGLAPVVLYEEELRRGSLVIIPVQTPILKTSYGFVYRSDRTLSAAAKEFMRIVQKIERPLAEKEEILTHPEKGLGFIIDQNKF